jgi:hypothetical protein
MIPVSRLQGEGAKAFAMFRCFLEMGDKRSLAKVARKCSKSIHLARKWSRLFQWKGRVKSWQLEELQRARAADEQAKLEHARMLEARRETRREDAWKLYNKFIVSCEEHLALPLRTSKAVDASRLAQMAQVLGAIASGDDVSDALLTGKGLQPPAPVNIACHYRLSGEMNGHSR